ncbi:MAG: hypothetical protein LQ342_001156 [Letrouitia transgressa]|nr:MAG: hypothetical protein LQ342_001156 [Letrouitia transgressa]
MTGPFNLRAAVLFLTAAGLLTVYFRHEKDRLERKKIADMSKGIGRPLIGGPFVLKDTDGAEWTEEKLKGGFTLVYFGFTHCPDICPEELDKMAHVISRINKTPPNFTAPPPSTITEPQNRPNLLPLFITCDPARDTPDVLRSYLAEFHPSLVGLTGDYEQIKEMCKQYRVYFSTPEGVKPGMDYLVDHSIYFFLMDPEGDFIEAIGRQHTPDAAAELISGHMSDWKKGLRLY